jgi:hypothetical protein
LIGGGGHFYEEGSEGWLRRMGFWAKVGFFVGEMGESHLAHILIGFWRVFVHSRRVSNEYLPLRRFGQSDKGDLGAYLFGIAMLLALKETSHFFSKKNDKKWTIFTPHPPPLHFSPQQYAPFPTSNPITTPSLQIPFNPKPISPSTTPPKQNRK